MFRTLFPSILVLAIAVGGSAIWLQNRNDISNLAHIQGLDEVTDVQATTEAPEIVEMTIGAENAPVTIVEYASFTCPHCATFHNDTFKKLKADYIDSGKVKFIYREVYFDRYGLWASMVARCGGQEKFFGIADLIYKSQSEWTRAGEPAAIVDELRKIGRLAGLDNETLDECLKDGAKAEALVAWYTENSKEDDISSTPSFVIDGKKHSNMSYADMKELLDDALAG